ncbi:MAG TPA: hypothetical protein ENN56_04970 [Firmicutes bacterium]|nr:hypothetical protein [Bacillota bacterium]
MKLFGFMILAASAVGTAATTHAAYDPACPPIEDSILSRHWVFSSPIQQRSATGDSTIMHLQTGWDRYGVGKMSDHRSYGWRSIVFWTIGTSVESQVFDVVMPQMVRWSYDPFQTNWFRSEAWKRDPAIRYYLMPNTARDPVRGQPERPARRVD